MKQFRFEGRVAVITGAGRGLGRAYAHLLAGLGARVIVNDLGGSQQQKSPSPAPADQVVAEIRQAGGEAAANYASVATAQGAQSIIDQAIGQFGRLDIVINNAGIGLPGAFDSQSLDDVRLMLDTHIFGVVAVTKAAWPHLRAAGYGRVVNTTSQAVFGLPEFTAYAAAKGAIFGLTRSLALEAPPGIQVNAVAPLAATRMMSESGLMSSQELAAMEKSLPPALVAPVTAYLAHESCTLNGQVLSAAGGSVTSWLIGETRGFVNPQLSIEDVHNHLAEIMTKDSFRPFGSGRETQA
jgi:NAD(P)-dependent dehydrogenase (short-subunit alcohol dehydrogenase family)